MAGGSAAPSQGGVSLEEGKSYTHPFVTITFLFFMWGFITCMNDILIPYLKGIFELSFFQASLVQFAFFGAFFIVSLAYFLTSVYYGDPISKIGYKRGIIIGLILAGTGCCLFYPAAELRVYGLFLGALFILASGVTVLQIAANPYAAILGKPETSSSRLNLAQGFNSFGTTIAPVIGSYLIHHVFASGDGSEVTVDNVKLPYVIFGLTFIALALLIQVTPLPKFTNSEKLEKGAGALKYKHLVFGMGAIFFYVGGEVAIGSFLINFFSLDHIKGIGEDIGSKYLSYYWGGAMIGRFLGAISLSNIDNQAKKLGIMGGTSILTFILIFLITGLEFESVSIFFAFLALNFAGFLLGKSEAGRSLAVFASIVIVLLLNASFGSGELAFWSVIGIGLFNSIMWSNIFTLAIKDLGPHTSQGSSLLVMAIVGGALIPPIQAFIADSMGDPDLGIQRSFLLPIICYAYIAFYGLRGHKTTPLDTDNGAL